MAESKKLSLATQMDGSATIGLISIVYPIVPVGGCTNIKITIHIPIPIQLSCYVVIIFPDQFKIDKDLITKIMVSGFFNNDGSTTLSMAYVTWVGNMMIIEACQNWNYI